MGAGLGEGRARGREASCKEGEEDVAKSMGGRDTL